MFNLPPRNIENKINFYGNLFGNFTQNTFNIVGHAKKILVGQ